MSLKYFKYSNNFFESKTTQDEDIKGKFLRKDPDKLIKKAGEQLNDLNFEEALKLFSKAYRNAKNDDKDEAIDHILNIVDEFQNTKMSELDENKATEFTKFSSDLDLALIDGDRKLNAALRKISHAIKKLDKAEEEIQANNYVKASEFVKDAERKIDKAYFKKVEDSKASEDDKEIVKSKINNVIQKIQDIESRIKSHTEKNNNEAEKERVEKKLDKRDIDAIVSQEAETLGTALSGGIDVTEEPTVASSTTVSDEPKPVVKNEPSKDILNSGNILQVALDPNLYKTSKLKKTLNDVEAKRIAMILWNAMDGIGTNEELLFNAIKSPSLKTLADYSYLSDVYKNISKAKGDDPVQDLYLAIYDTLLGQVELTTSEREEISNIILDRVNSSLKK